jgi:RNA polymerase subunit RPABC4/transcription elongation factor Spt4
MALTGRERDEQRRRIVVLDRSVCQHCKRKGLTNEDKFCPDCGFPQQGAESEQRRFIVEKRRERSKAQENECMVKRARYYLQGAALMNMLSFISDEPLVVVVGLVISSVFVALSFWAKTKAYPAILTGLLTYVSIQLFFGVFHWQFLMSGLIVKIAIVGALWYALRAAKELELRKMNGDTSA